MNQLIKALCILVLVSSCSLFEDYETKGTLAPILPDSTLLVAGVATYSPDAAYYGTEVIVGRLINDGYYPSSEQKIPGSYWPIVRGQFLTRAGIASANIFAEKNARIILKNVSRNKEFELIQVASGVYADPEFKLKFFPTDSLTLSVSINSEEKYFASTVIPDSPICDLPDTLFTELDLKIFNTTPVGYAENTNPQYSNLEKRFEIIKPFSGFKNGNIFEITMQLSNQILENGGEFKDTLPNNYVKLGRDYRYGTYGVYDDSVYFWGAYWIATSNVPVQSSIIAYSVISQIDPFFSKGYNNIRNLVTTPANGTEIDPAFTSRDSIRKDYLRKDNSYLYRVSNIYDADSDGKSMYESPKKAVGIFGSRTSIYRKTVLYPIRSWDPDTLKWRKN